MNPAIWSYEFTVDGHLDAHWASWLDTDRFRHDPDGNTSFRTRPIDQAQLHGVLNQLRDLGAVVHRVAAVETPGTTTEPTADVPPPPTAPWPLRPQR